MQPEMPSLKVKDVSLTYLRPEVLRSMVRFHMRGDVDTDHLEVSFRQH